MLCVVPLCLPQNKPCNSLSLYPFISLFLFPRKGDFFVDFRVNFRNFAADIAHSVAEQMSTLTIDSIKVVMGDTINLCTMEEAVQDFKIKKPTLNSWIAKGLIIPLKKGRKNMFLREDLVRLTRKKIG